MNSSFAINSSIYESIPAGTTSTGRRTKGVKISEVDGIGTPKLTPEARVLGIVGVLELTEKIGAAADDRSGSELADVKNILAGSTAMSTCETSVSKKVMIS
tara:strand:+ start:238 stop:540 length:303 start_codon:yes stop_codon:yes gene_type:complete